MGGEEEAVPLDLLAMTNEESERSWQARSRQARQLRLQLQLQLLVPSRRKERKRKTYKSTSSINPRVPCPRAVEPFRLGESEEAFFRHCHLFCVLCVSFSRVYARVRRLDVYFCFSVGVTRLVLV